MAGCSLPSERVTERSRLPATTWLFVSMSPFALRTTPLPSASPCARVARMSTVLGSTVCAAAVTDPGAASTAPEPCGDEVRVVPGRSPSSA